MKDIVIIGIGQLGGVFAKGFLRLGHRVTPVNRGGSIQACAETIPDPEIVLITVGEGDLSPTLDRLPDSWRSCVGLVQNELLPRDWERAQVEEPSVMIFRQTASTSGVTHRGWRSLWEMMFRGSRRSW